jgi:acyl-CoA synthetase (AMP-forming)/AMP-acid ligase II
MNTSYQTLIDALQAAPAEKPFVTMWNSDEDSSTVSFGEFSQWAQRQASMFARHGLTRNDKIILIMPQGIELMAAFAGAMMLGAVPAILAYPNFKVEPNKYRFGIKGVTSNLRARLIVLDAAFPGEMLDFIASAESTEVVRSVGQKGGEASGPVILGPARSQDLAFIQHSAGTTGLQKGVALSHAAVLRQLHHLCEVLRLRPEDRVYSWLPLYHDMGLIACFMMPMVLHMHVVMQSPTDWVMSPGTMLQLISQYRCTLAWVPNFAFQFVARRADPEDISGLDLSSARMLINCSEPVRASSIDEFVTALAPFGLRPEAMQSSYAMAENVFAVTQSGVGDRPMPACTFVRDGDFRNQHRAVPCHAQTPGALCFVSSGSCLPNNEVRIVSDGGADLPEGGVGEILIRSDSMLDGYYNRPDLTAKILKDGWYWSGDLGFLLDGELYVVGRKKDLIIIAGKNIYPQDVEEIVFSHPSIHPGRAVAFGIYNQELGTEDLIAVAEVNDETSLADALRIESAIKNAIIGELGVTVRTVYLKPPKWIIKSTAGKPARSSTREKLMSEHPELQRT